LDLNKKNGAKVALEKVFSTKFQYILINLSRSHPKGNKIALFMGAKK